MRPDYLGVSKWIPVITCVFIEGSRKIRDVVLIAEMRERFEYSVLLALKMEGSGLEKRKTKAL